MPAKKWKFVPHDRVEIQAFADRCGISPVVAQLLLKRGIKEPEDARRFLEAKLIDLRPPEELPGLLVAVERISTAIQAGEEIVVYGDYDADGMTATAILYGCLRLLKAKVSYHLPNRMEEGYGLHTESIEKLAAHGKQLVITVDCGIASIEPARRAKELGLSLVITDHHRFGDELPVADAIVHPALPGAHYPFTGLCGAGVAFKLAWALCQRQCGTQKVSEPLREFLLQALGLAAIGTVADVVPLIDENRIIVRNGLKTLHRNPPIGLRKLMELTKVSEKSELAAEDIGFMLAPRLNAAGRLGQAQLGVELLVTTDEARAEALANYIQVLNENRNKLERSIQLSATKQLKEVHSADDDPAFVLSSPTWHPGVIGIVAGKLAEKYNRPVVLVALDKLGTKPGTGSARSANGVNLHEAIQDCREWLVSGGGHAAAAGLRIEETNLRDFSISLSGGGSRTAGRCRARSRTRLRRRGRVGATRCNGTQPSGATRPVRHGEPSPPLCAMGVALAEAPKLLGESGRHLSVQLSQHGNRLRAVAFGQAEEWLPKLSEVETLIDLAFRPVINEFRGYRKVELHLVDWRVHQVGERLGTLASPGGLEPALKAQPGHAAIARPHAAPAVEKPTKSSPK